MNNLDLHSLAAEALDAFWQVIQRNCPEAQSGDLSIDRTMRLRAAALLAIEEWIANNHPFPPADQTGQTAAPYGPVTIGYRFKLTRPVDRFPDFVAKIGLMGTVLAVEGDLWALMDQVIPGAETWDNQIYWDTVAEFLDDTKACP